MKLFTMIGQIGTIMDTFNKKFGNGNYSIIERKIHERDSGNFWIEVWYKDKELSKSPVPLGEEK